MRTTRLLTAALVVGSASFGFLPLAHADASTEKLTPSAEAWFQPNPTCATPVGCLGPESLPAALPLEIPLSPFPAGSMHVAIEAGQETARSYLTFSLPLLDAILTAGSLDVPLDEAAADGSLQPEASQVLVCTFQGALPAGSSLSTPPPAACTKSAPATYVLMPTPHLHADLAPLLEDLAAGAGLVLLPDAAKVAPTDAWHAVFSAHDRADAAKTAPASLTVTVQPVEPGDTTVPPVTTPVDSGTVVPPLDPVAVPALPVTEVPMAPTVSNPAPTVPVQAVPQARTITVGYAYPTVWLLPLAFLIVVPGIARMLTRDLTPVPS